MRKKTVFLSSEPLIYPSILGCVLVFFFLFCGKFFAIESIWPDEALYLWCGKLIAAHPFQLFSKEVLAFHLPLFPLCLALFAKSAFFIIAAKSIPCLFGAAGILLLYYLGRSMVNAFTGLCAAIALSFNYLYFSYSTRSLSDIPMTALFIFAAACLHRAFKKTSGSAKLSSAGLFLSGVAAIAFKWSGGLLLFILAVYYLGRAVIEKDHLPRRAVFWKTFFAIIGTTLIFLLINFIALGSPLPKLTALGGEIFIKPWWYYIIFVPITIGWSLLILGLYGAIRLFRLNSHTRWVVLSWLAAPVFILSAAHEKDLRYALPILPAVFLLCGLGADSLLQALTKRWPQQREKVSILFLLVFFFAAFSQFTADRPILETEIHRYTGYPDAGKWILENASADTVILASSPRAVRFFTGINLNEYGGRILPLPETKEEFEQLAKNTSSLILELDRWAFHNPRWAYPPRGENLAYFASLGKTDVHLIGSPYTTASEKKGQPVIFLIRIRK